MKRCPACQQTYEDDALSFCLNDGAQLVSATASNPQETLHIPASRSTDPTGTPQQETWRAGPTFTPPVTQQAHQRNWLPWILGGLALLIVGAIGIVIFSAIVYYKLSASNVNSNTSTYNSNQRTSNSNASSSDSGTRKPGGTSPTSKDSLANTSAQSVTELAPPQAGNYRLGGVKVPQGHIFKNEGATELMMATYDRTDGSNFVLLYLGSFSTSDKAQSALEKIVKWSVGQGAKIQSQEPNTGRSGEPLGVKYVLRNEEGVEDVYWSNGRYAFNAYNGKKETGVLTLFEKAYPY
jgi:hypothetical protein